MMGLKKPQLFALLASVVVIVLLVLMPRTPSGKNEAMAATAMDPAKAKLAEAVALVQGQDPMRGIQMLREIVEQEPNNAEAHWNLGLFSVQSGQYERALERFKKVRDIDAAGFPDVWFYLGRTYATMDSIDQAIACLTKYKTLTQDTAILKGVDGFLTDLKNTQH